MLTASPFARLCSRLDHLADVLQGTRITLSVDRPREPDSALRERCESALIDCQGWLAEAGAEAAAARECLEAPRAADVACKHLDACSDRLLRMAEAADARLLEPELLAELAALGQRRGGEWKAWAGQARAALRAWREPRHEVLAALIACWRELACTGPYVTIAVRAASDIESTRTQERLAGDR